MVLSLLSFKYLKKGREPEGEKNAQERRLVFWDVTLCSLVVRHHYLEDNPASIFMVEAS
jgi:hypothetical protein